MTKILKLIKQLLLLILLFICNTTFASNNVYIDNGYDFIDEPILNEQGIQVTSW